MLGLARALSLEGAEHGIKTNCILPVAPFGRKGPVPAALAQQRDSTSLPPDDAGPELVAPMVVYLASRACSVTGEAFSAGGRRFGCLTAFVEAGIHASDLAEPDGLSRLCAKYGAVPDFVIPKLLW